MTTQSEVTKIGNLTKDPIPGDGKATNFARFSIAVKPHVPQGEPEPETVFYEVTCFGTVATHVCTSLVKGDRVSVTGKPEVDTWTGRDNRERTTKRIIANCVAVDLRFASVRIDRAAKRSPASSLPTGMTTLDAVQAREIPGLKSSGLRALSDDPEF